MKHKTYNQKSKEHEKRSLFHVSCFKFQESGFTLIELMVSIGVFAVVVGMMSSMLMTSLRGQKKSITSQNMADNVRFAMEMMSKEIRMGNGFTVDDNNGLCGVGVKCRLQFKSTMPNRYDQTLVFYLESGQIMFDDDHANIASIAAPITSAQNIAVASLVFDVTGDVGNNTHPRVTIVMRAKSAGTSEDVSTSYDIQTTLSPRKL